MGRAGRFACIFLPLCATVAAAVLIVIAVFIGQTNSGNSFENSLYFLRLDTRNIDANSTIDLLTGTALDNYVSVDASVENAAKLLGLPDFYQAGFWGYCTGTVTNTSGVVNWQVQNCSKPTAFFAFDLIDIINEANSTGGNLTFPTAVEDAFKAVKALSRAQWICFIAGIIATGVEFGVGWFGLLSRLGSCVTTLVANFAFFALLAGGVINIILYKSLEVAFNKTYSQFGIKAQFNTHIYALMFIGIALSLGAAIFWLFSSCCCSGRRDRVMKSRDGGDEKGGYRRNKKYERVPSPYTTPLVNGSTDGHAFQPQQHSTPYEPMRHQQV